MAYARVLRRALANAQDVLRTRAIDTQCDEHDVVGELESSHTLLVDLSAECALAWRLLTLRWFTHNHPTTPASQVMPAAELLVLAAYMRKKKRAFPEAPTAMDAQNAVASIGGHLRSNGAPGWLVLRRGFEKLQSLVDGWLLAAAEVA